MTAAAVTESIDRPMRKPPKSTESNREISSKELALRIMRKPFEAHQISTMCKPTRKDNQPGRCPECRGWHKLPAVQLSYVGHAALTDRLLEADPEWTWEPLAYAADGSPLIDSDGGMWIKLTVAGVTRLGYGDAQGKMGGDATKERIGDALRNAAMRFGAALELWHKGVLHLDEVQEEDVPQISPAENEEPSEVNTPPAAPAADKILSFQKTAILTAAKKSGKTNGKLNEYLTSIGCKSLDEMPKDKFKDALKWAMEQ